MNHHAGRKVTSEPEHGSAAAGRIECPFESCRCARMKTQNVVRYRGMCQIAGGEHKRRVANFGSRTPLRPLYLRFYEDHPSAAVGCEPHGTEERRWGKRVKEAKGDAMGRSPSPRRRGERTPDGGDHEIGRR